MRHEDGYSGYIVGDIWSWTAVVYFKTLPSCLCW